MSKKSNKIMVCVSPVQAVRTKMVASLMVRLGLAAIASDARKIISNDIRSYDLGTAYLVACDNYYLADSPLITQRLYELSARGIAVIVGSKTIPRGYDFVSEAFYPENF
ncbi:hypothetical protein [Phocaeicola barnesiae]